jgi:hypothetical protein
VEIFIERKISGNRVDCDEEFLAAVFALPLSRDGFAGFPAAAPPPGFGTGGHAFMRCRSSRCGVRRTCVCGERAARGSIGA